MTTSVVSQQQKVKTFWILMQQEMMQWQWHQLNHMHIICTQLQTDMVTVIAPYHSFFYRTNDLPDIQPTVSKVG